MNRNVFIAASFISFALHIAFGQILHTSSFGESSTISSEPTVITAAGNAVQTAGSGGWVKAMVVLNETGNIVRCYNGTTGTSTAGCGFTSQQFAKGRYSINFGFDISNRFYSLTGLRSQGNYTPYTLMLDISGNILNFTTVQWDGTSTDGSACIIIF